MLGNFKFHKINQIWLTRRIAHISIPLKTGFTLIELMVVIAIVAVLSVVGIVVFNNVQKSARDSANISNVNAIAKAYETKYLNTGSYLTGSSPTIDSSYFAGGVVPTPSGSNYLLVKNDSSGGLKVCAPVNGNTQSCSDTSSTCFCKGVSQATPPDQTSTNSYYSLIADGTVTTTTAPQASPNPTPNPTPSVAPPPAPPAATNTNQPIGNFETATCTSIVGWACDNDASATAIPANFYDGSGLTNPIGNITAGANRSDLITANVCGGTGNHGFTFTTPSSIKDGFAHNIYIYGTNIDSTGAPAGTNPQVPGSPKTLTCAIGSGSNLLNNPGFESGNSNWTNCNTSGTGTCAIESNASLVHSGTKSMRVAHNGSGWGTAAFYTNIPAPGTNLTYCLSAWIKKDQTTSTAGILIQDQNGTWATSGVASAATTNWQFVKGNVVKASNWTGNVIQVAATAGTSGASIRFDDFSLYQGPCL